MRSLVLDLDTINYTTRSMQNTKETQMLHLHTSTTDKVRVVPRTVPTTLYVLLHLHILLLISSVQIVALNSAEYDGGAHCFEMITITINGQTTQAQITDECPGCSAGGLDFSQGLFQFFAPLSEGELYGSWSYDSDVATSSSTPAPSTTSYTPSSTPATTVTTTASSSSTALSTSITMSTVVPSPSPTSTSTTTTVPTSTPQDPQMITQVNLALLELGVLLQASFKLEN
ncbi:hypothetical protein OG21DRAFT_61137 [Imleria badia]|nr:hypothetical protein OG21DRAFT_61137 [Imleria badia]